MSTEKDIAERLRAAFVQHHGNKVGDPFVSQIAREIAAAASAIEARRAETGTGSVHESAAREAGTPIPSLVGEVVEAARALLHEFPSHGREGGALDGAEVRYKDGDASSISARALHRVHAALSALDSAPRIGTEEIARCLLERNAGRSWGEAATRTQDHYLDEARAVLSLLASGVPADDTPPSLPNASQYYATDKSGQWHYVNHAGTWQACPPPFSSPAERAIRNEALEEAKQVTTERYHPALDSLKTKDA